MTPPALLIVFVAGTSIEREPAFTTGLPIVRNGPPGTFVCFGGGDGGSGGSGSAGERVPLPTDQIISGEVVAGCARVGFGGMQFAGEHDGWLVFHRVRDLLPEAELSPERRSRMTLALRMVTAIFAHGRQVWPVTGYH